MKQFLLTLSITILLLIFGTTSRAQYVIKEADVKFELLDYIKAIDLYEQAYQKKATLHAAERLAQCYSFVDNYEETESWYAITVAMPGSDPLNMYRYAEALKNNAKYNEAKEAFIKYTKLDSKISSSLLNSWIASCDSSSIWMKNPKHIVISNLRSINTSKSDWGAVAYGTDIVFSSDRDDMPSYLKNPKKRARPFLKLDGRKLPDKEVYGWTGNRYLNLYIQRGNTGSIEYFPATVNTDYHVGPASFTADGKEQFFTTTQVSGDGHLDQKNISTINFGIYSRKMDSSGNWTNPVSFKYNKPSEYSVGDPYISKDGKILYFTSNMPGGKGGTDIYYCTRNADGSWAAPVNLAAVNTEGNERTPSFDDNKNFYFSSDGLIGMGGLDIFKSTVLNGHFSTPINVGYPLNSSQDDFATNFDTPTSGFFSSNRPGGLGNDDIYRFSIQEEPIFRLVGTVYESTTHQPIKNAVLSLSKTDGSILKVQTGEDGKFRYDLDTNSSYNLMCVKTGFKNGTTSLSTVNLTNSTTIRRDFYLDQIILNKEIVLKNIYYDFDKSNIRQDAVGELDTLVKLLNDNPTMWIQIGSHTDSRGGKNYNLLLSQRRADAAVQYIIKRGINKNRITAMGYGDTRLVNGCVVGVKCSEKEHQANRRTEFHIVKY